MANNIKLIIFILLSILIVTVFDSRSKKSEEHNLAKNFLDSNREIREIFGSDFTYTLVESNLIFGKVAGLLVFAGKSSVLETSINVFIEEDEAGNVSLLSEFYINDELKTIEENR